MSVRYLAEALYHWTREVEDLDNDCIKHRGDNNDGNKNNNEFHEISMILGKDRSSYKDDRNRRKGKPACECCKKCSDCRS